MPAPTIPESPRDRHDEYPPQVNLNQSTRHRILQALANRRIAVMLPLGFASGLPLALTGQTLQAWLSVENAALGTIGIFTLVGLPYTLKFLWAPFMDRFVPRWLGRRRGWMILTQFGLLAGIASIAVTGPSEPILLLGMLALVVAFVSASQDSVPSALIQIHLKGNGKVDYVTARMVEHHERSNYGNPVYYTRAYPLFYWFDRTMWNDPEQDGVNGNELVYQEDVQFDPTRYKPCLFNGQRC